MFAAVNPEHVLGPIRFPVFFQRNVTKFLPENGQASQTLGAFIGRRETRLELTRDAVLVREVDHPSSLILVNSLPEKSDIEVFFGRRDIRWKLIRIGDIPRQRSQF